MQKKLDFRFHLTREPVIIAVLSVGAMLCFAAVSGLSGMYHGREQSLGVEWFNRGSEDLKAGRYAPAVEEFRTALLYSRDNYIYQLSLAEALKGLGRTDAASAYFMNLWDREPENGVVNLELARIAANGGQPNQALRYYHNAIYATWPDEATASRREARLELIHYLLTIHNRAQARSELIALEANLDDPAVQTQVGALFLQAQDYADALNAFRQGLKASKKNPAALAGAGKAAFQLTQYRTAAQYLRSAATLDSGDKDLASLLETSELVLNMNPFQHDIPAGERYQIVMKAFAAAGDRLKSCPALSTAPAPATATQNLSDDWAKMKPQMTERGLRRDPDLVENSMDLVFEIERQAAAACGTPTPMDNALLLIAHLHEGN
ncbi:MAG TPA: tetratricopeptide repeat protein [Bryobacteraceae bacterium]|jgi:tetratricopeptide (TPR) repeat protein|nr:tetratricopeptide repeat protein [Bryobacteraceae bacterium]